MDFFFETQECRGKKGVVPLGMEAQEEIELERYDVVIMNTPFTRQERMPEDTSFERFEEYEKYLRGQIGCNGYFILLADKFVKVAEIK